jgi:hypothetical protein
LIGLRSSGTTADSNFAEAGILIAYIAAAGGAATSLVPPRRLVNHPYIRM